jgi:hypothetical protein
MLNNEDINNYCKKILDSNIISEPFPHIMVEDFLNDDFYDKFIAEINSNDLFQNAPEEHNRSTRMLWNGKATINKDLNSNYKQIFVSLLLNNEIRKTIFSKFITNKYLPNDIISKHKGTNVQLDCFRGDYKYPIHTDIQGKLITILFYLPKDNNMSELGTNLYDHKKNFVKNTGYTKNKLVIFCPIQKHNPDNNQFISYHNMQGNTPFYFRRYSIQSWFTSYAGRGSGGNRSGKNSA